MSIPRNLGAFADNVSSAGLLNTSGITGTVAIANGGTNSTATPTAGGVVYGDGSAHQITSAGTSGQVLQSNGSSAPSWVTMGSSGMVLMSTQTASSSASLSFSIGGYSKYFVHFNLNLSNTSGMNLLAQVGSGGGPTYTTSGYNTATNKTANGTNTAVNNASSSGFWLTTGQPIASQVSGGFYLSGVTSAFVAEITGFSNYYSSGGTYAINETFGGSANVNLNVTGLKILTAAGTMSSGTISLYGLS
jgi:hypothetical protein